MIERWRRRLVDLRTPVGGTGESIVAGVIVGILMSVAVASAFDAIRAAIATEAVWLQAGPVAESMEHRALHGDWPGSLDWTQRQQRRAMGEPDRDGEIGHYLSGAEYDGAGQVTFSTGAAYPGDGGTISIRPAVAAESDAVTWLCGHRHAPDGFEVAHGAPPVRTSLATLPSPCREAPDGSD